MDDLWNGTARFMPFQSFPQSTPEIFPQIDAGTRVVVVNSTWYLFGRWDGGHSTVCPQYIQISVRSSTDSGRTWGKPDFFLIPDEKTTCIFADGSAFFDEETITWHYLTQALAPKGVGGWTLNHFTLQGREPFGTWTANSHNPVVRGGALFAKICAGNQKHCEVGTADEGTPQIVEKVDGEFIVTFHGYDYTSKHAARGVARTADFVTWETTGGASALPGDAIFARGEWAPKVQKLIH
jgi:hypothetical protein